MTTLFFSDQITGDKGLLSPEESVHCLKVLRHKKGDIISVTDGQGNIYNAEITIENFRECSFRITGRQILPFTKNYKVHIAISPLKNQGRLEWFFEKAAEIGVDTITPVICERTERKSFNRLRIHKILVSAIMQAGIPWLPELLPARTFSEFAGSLPLAENGNPDVARLIGYCEGDSRAKVSDVYKKGSDVVFMIGPEGDFTSTEIEIAKKFRFVPVILGNTRLRTETAGIMACATISILNL